VGGRLIYLLFAVARVAWDWESFGWGVLVGFGLAVVVGAVAVYSLKERVLTGLGAELAGRAVSALLERKG
jgi:ABC-type uncharacterized transport system permease subunit